MDRARTVKRHNPKLTGFDYSSPLSVGNGELAFTVDPTGLQTFSECYDDFMPVCTQSQWGWHTRPPGQGSFGRQGGLRAREYDNYGRRVGYLTSSRGQKERYDWLRKNPHRLNLGRIAFDTDSFINELRTADIRQIRQELDLWSGIISSDFSVRDIPVRVKTCCAPDLDAIAVYIESDLIRNGKLQVYFSFPYGNPGITASDWTCGNHRTSMISLSNTKTEVLRVLDRDRYFVTIQYPQGCNLSRKGLHVLELSQISRSCSLEFTCHFSPIRNSGTDLSYARVERKCIEYWNGFWEKGGLVDLSDSRDVRAAELERRIVLSQYLTAIQCCGSLPPQETGLTCNSWHGKFHLEMHYWHAAHFPLWGRAHLLERSLWWYLSIMESARGRAAFQGYRGVRWPKMTEPQGEDSPSPIGPLLIWQQPHPIMLAELCYRAHPEKNTLDLYREMVFETADFMASYANRDGRRDRYVLGPPVIPAQENHDPEATLNPAFELEYWAFGLKTAIEWRRRLDLHVPVEWERVLHGLSEIPRKAGCYLAHERCPLTYEKFNYDHPSMLAALGVLPGDKVDAGTMQNTLERVLDAWDFERCWGWDFPMIAMTATRLGKPEKALDILLLETPKNTYLLNGHNRQGSEKRLPLYLPGNGALLIAVACMTAGWDGMPPQKSGESPGFPSSAGWKAVWEEISPLP